MKVIAISGWKRSGKDSAADYLVKNHGFTRVSFADPLKDSVAEEFSIQRSWLDDPEFKEAPLLNLPVHPQDAYSRMIANFLAPEFRTKKGVQIKTEISPTYTVVGGILLEPIETLYWTPRAICILKGSSNRSVRSDFWVQKAIEKIKNSADQNIIISDLRYQSEFVQLREAFGDNLTTVRIERFDSITSKDPSELDLVGYPHDITIQNKLTLEDFLSKIDQLVK